MKGIKVSYLVMDEVRSTAYIDEDTGIGTDKYSDEPVRLRFDEGAGIWVKADTGESQ